MSLLPGGVGVAWVTIRIPVSFFLGSREPSSPNSACGVLLTRRTHEDVVGFLNSSLNAPKCEFKFESSMKRALIERFHCNLENGFRDHAAMDIETFDDRFIEKSTAK